MRIKISPDQDGLRLDAALAAQCPEISRSRIQKAIQAGNCYCSGASLTDPALKVRTGLEIELELPRQDARLEPVEGEIEVLWEDADIAVCVKPCGLTVHPCPSCAEKTLAHLLLARFPQLESQGGERPGIVHRLDRDTSGLILVALSERARLRLAQAFAQREIKKEYLALVTGNPPATGSSEKPIGRHQKIKTRMAIVAEKKGGRSASTQWRRIWHNDRIALLALAISTGRTHQIRVHLADSGFPILGDATYADKNTASMAPRQMLHAWKLSFRHPVTGEALAFVNAPPADFFETLGKYEERSGRVVVTGNQGCGKSSFCHALGNLGVPVTSADAIVARLYAGKSEATDWIRSHIGEDALTTANAVDKKKLFAILEKRPELKHELETVVHRLVLSEIEAFWASHADAVLAVAEVPLYFESGFSSLISPEPLVIGVSCPEKIRWQRIRETRGWSEDKIETIEKWQWQEKRKMAACDLVIANDGSPHDLKEQAAKFREDFLGKQAEAKERLLARLKAFCSCPDNETRPCKQPKLAETFSPSQERA